VWQLPHYRTINKDVILLKVFKIIITLARLIASSLIMVEDRNM